MPPRKHTRCRAAVRRSIPPAATELPRRISVDTPEMVTPTQVPSRVPPRSRKSHYGQCELHRRWRYSSVNDRPYRFWQRPNRSRYSGSYVHGCKFGLRQPGYLYRFDIGRPRCRFHGHNTTLNASGVWWGSTTFTVRFDPALTASDPPLSALQITIRRSIPITSPSRERAFRLPGNGLSQARLQSPTAEATASAARRSARIRILSLPSRIPVPPT